MRNFLMAGAAVAVLAACGQSGTDASPEKVTAALTQMALDESGSGLVQFEDKAVEGDRVVLKDVLIKGSDIEKRVVEAAEAAAEEGDEVSVEMDAADISIAELVFDGLNVADNGETTFSSLQLSDITIEDKDQPEGLVKIKSLSLNNPTPELSAWISGLMGNSEAVAAPDFTKVEFDSFSLDNFLAEGTDEDGEGTFTVANISIKDFRENAAGLIKLSGMNVDFADENDVSGVVKLDSIEMKGADFKWLKAFENEDEDEMTQALVSTLYGNPADPGFDSLVMKGFNFDAAGLKMDAPQFSYKTSRNADGEVTRLSMEEFNFTLDTDPDGGELGAQAAPALLALGFDGLRISGAGDTVYDPSKDLASSEKGFIQIDNAFRLESGGTIGGYKAIGSAMSKLDFSALEDNDAAAEEAMLDVYSRLSFHDISLSLKDLGLVDKALAFQAAQSGMDPEELRNQAVMGVNMLAFMGGSMGIDPGLTGEFVGAASKFLTEPGTLTLSFAPTEPLTLGEAMEDPTLLTKERLGFTATAE